MEVQEGVVVVIMYEQLGLIKMFRPVDIVSVKRRFLMVMVRDGIQHSEFVL
jgi:hypothetical protein